MYTDITPAKRTGLLGADFIACDEAEATHWHIRIGFDGQSGDLILPSRQAAEACMLAFVRPYERGEL